MLSMLLLLYLGQVEPISPGQDQFLGMVAVVRTTAAPPVVEVIPLGRPGTLYQLVLHKNTHIQWRDDPTPLPVAALRCADRVWCDTSYSCAERIELLGFGVHAPLVELVEQAIAASRQRYPRSQWRLRAQAYLSAAQLDELELLGSRRYAVRAAVAGLLRQQGAAVLPQLLWARDHPDPEIREQAIALLSWVGRDYPQRLPAGPVLVDRH